MVMRQSAYGQGRSIVHAIDLAKREFGDEIFTCIGCDSTLIAKVRGTERSPHFAHHPGAMCNEETYLHRLGKQVFSEELCMCRETGTPFEIELNHPITCRRFEDYLESACVSKSFETKVYDLTNEYDHVAIEPCDGSFIPDLLLTNSKTPKDKLYIEIAVTHFLSDKKRHSSRRIIEIPLKSEADLAIIRSHRLTEKNANFVNVESESRTMTDADCKCGGYQAFAFLVYKSGKCRLEEGTVASLVQMRHNARHSIQYFQVYVADKECGDVWRIANKSEVFRGAVLKAFRDGCEFQNCYLCTHQANSFRKEPGKPVYCKKLKTICASNDAILCDSFVCHGNLFN